MRSIHSDKLLSNLAARVDYYARSKFNMTLPEMRYVILDPLEFASLLEKHVYPTSPVNIWEGKNIVNKKRSIETGQESALYYEVVQTGNPSYAYLNDSNTALTQASVMAHVCGHCEFSELNVLGDSDHDRTEYVSYLVKKVDLARRQMGEQRYISYWNSCESIVSLIAPNSQYNLSRCIDIESVSSSESSFDTEAGHSKALDLPYSSTLNSILRQDNSDLFVESENKRKISEVLSRRGYRLRAPCQDILGFLKNYSPTSWSEATILNYLYTRHKHQDFVVRTQIMNEGWAMYWEKKIMMELFSEDAVRGVIDYAKVFSGVCYPRPWFQRNPYHLGYHMWGHIEELYKKGKISLDYEEETDLETKENWSKKPNIEPHKRMRHLVKTITDYEFLRRYLTPELVERYHLNRIPIQMAKQLRIKDDDIQKANKQWIWLHAQPVIPEMLRFFTHYFRPRIYIIDNDFMDGGLLLFHRNDGRDLRKDWIKPTLNNIKSIWKAPVYLYSKETLYSYRASKFDESKTVSLEFDSVVEKMRQHKKPFVVN